MVVHDRNTRSVMSPSASNGSGEQEELFFAIDARHIRQLGQQLVGNRVTALSELIKNAYDADATTVTLTFTDASAQQGGTLAVRDDGSGMTLEDVRSKWMRISTAAKELEDTSPRFGRLRAGRKGIGRFAAETIGGRLILRSSVAGRSERVVVEFNWEEAYRSGVDLTGVANLARVEPVPIDEYGTELQITHLHDRWPPSSRSAVLNAVRLLRPPFPVADVVDGDSSSENDHEPDPGFQVVVVVDGQVERAAGDLDDFVDAATAVIRGEVDDQGVVRYALKSKPLMLETSHTRDDTAPETGPFSFEVAYFIFRSNTIGAISVRQAQQMGREFGGVRIYRDHLRLMPYGERGNDWLGLDEAYRERRLGQLQPIGTQNVFGQVLISRHDNPELDDTASREGLIENDAYRTLHAVVREGILWGTREVAAHRAPRPKPQPPPPTREETLTKLGHELERSIREGLSSEDAEPVVDAVSASIQNLLTEAQESDKAEREREQALLEEIDLLRVLSSLGTSIAVFSHEVGAALNAAGTAVELVRTRSDEAGREDALRPLNEALRRLRTLAGYIDGYVSESRRRERHPQPLHTVVQEFTEVLSTSLAAHVEFSWSVTPPGLRTIAMTRAELEAILMNFLTNAVKAMDAEGHAERRVHVQAFQDEGHAVLRFSDTGRGVSSQIRDRMFDAFVTTSTAQSELGSGTGLGLRIVADIAEAYGGSVSLGPAPEGFTTCLELRLPLAQG